MGRPPSDVRDRIVDAARERFLSDGVDGASLRDIASDAGTVLGTVVYHFPKKEDLFEGVVDAVYSPLVADLAVLLEEEGTTRERLQRVLLRIAAASSRELDVLRLIAREAIGSAPRRRRIVRRFMGGHVPRLLAALAEGVQRGELDAAIPVPMQLVALVGLGALPQIIRRVSGVRAMLPDEEALAAMSIELFFRALGARPPKEQRFR